MPTGIALDLGATHTRAGLIEHSGRILHRVSSPTPHEGIAEFLIALVQQVASPEEILAAEGIGISAAGPVDIQQGILVNPPNLPFRNLPLVGPLESVFGIPAYLANDCHAGIIGEACFGAARGVANTAYITLSTGIGGGILSGGRLLLGRDGNAAEIGHFLVDTTYSLRCGCGFTGHWEGYASGRFMPSFYRTWHAVHRKGPAPFPATAEEIFRAARNHDPNAVEFLEALGVINARGMSDVIVAYDPDWIVLDGSVALNNYSELVTTMEPHIDRFLPLPTICLSSLAGDAPLLGASILAQGYETPFGSLDTHRNHPG
jgi:Transcriptional regulator/sugar kinase